MQSKHFFLLALLCAFNVLRAQELPELEHVRLQSKNYYDICKQLDTYFATEYQAEEDACWDDEQVKYLRWKWFWRDRVQADGSFPDMKAQWQAYKQHKTVASRNFQSAWVHEGPTQNTGGGYWGMGRTKHVAFHPNNPNIYYVGTPDGGIWKTTDGGTTYQSLGDELPYLPVGVILIDQQHPDTLYISLGDKIGWWNSNLGVYKSTDGGQHWFPTGLDWNLAQNRVLYNMIMSPADPQTILAATNGGIRRTTDGGVNWTVTLAGEFTDVQYKPGDPNTVYVAKYDYWGQSEVFRSKDGGQSWTKITNFGLQYNTIRIAVTQANPEIVGLMFSEGKKLYVSNDSGDSFEFKSEMPENFVFAFSQVDPQIIYACNTVVNRSTDGGLTWEKRTNWYNDGEHDEIHADFHHIAYNPHNISELYFCNDGGLYSYNEPDSSWLDHSNGMGIAQFYRIAVSEAGSLRILAGSQDNGGWMKRPNGTWGHTNGGDAMTQAIDPTNSGIGFTEYYSGTQIYRSGNGFLSTTTINENIPGAPTGDWVTPFIMNPKNPKTMLFAFDNVYITYDRGNHFSAISDNLTNSADNKLRDIQFAESDTNEIAASYSNRFYVTHNHGQSWTKTLAPGTEDITRIAIHPSDNNRMWITRSGYSNGQKVYATTNSGGSWQNISANLPNVPVNCVIYDAPTNYLLVGTDIGVYYSDADQINWAPYGDGIPNVYVFDLKVRQASRRLYAGTHGRGIYSIPMESVSATEDLGANALQVQVSPNPASNTIRFAGAGEHIFSGSIVMSDPAGRQVFQQIIQEQKLSHIVLNINQIPPGVYVLQLASAQDHFAPLKVVVQH